MTYIIRVTTRSGAYTFYGPFHSRNAAAEWTNAQRHKLSPYTEWECLQVISAADVEDDK